MTTTHRSPPSSLLLVVGTVAALLLSGLVSISNVPPPSAVAANQPSHLRSIVPSTGTVLPSPTVERVLPPTTSSSAHARNISAAPASLVRATGAIASDPWAVTGSVIAHVNGYGAEPILSGVNVTAFGSNCTANPPSPGTCPVVNWTTTNLSGEFAMNLSNGTYYVTALPDPGVAGSAYPHGFGGQGSKVVVDGAAVSNDALPVDPFIPYGNTTIVLPSYTCDTPYMDYLTGGFKGGPECQNPVLSWTQDGAYYLTASNELVFYSFVNRTLYAIAAWAPLYQKGLADYPLVPNNLLITQDGAYLYSWGTLTSAGETITVEAVNITTHQVFEYNFTGVSTASTSSNGQLQMTGWDGDDSQVTLILANGSIIDHDLWSSTQSYVGKLSFFEGNNVYWMPYLNGYINVQADGSSSDHIEEWQLSRASSVALTKTFTGQWKSGGGIVVNGVNGVSFNVTSRQLSLGIEYSGVTYAVNGTGTLTTLLQVTNYYPSGTPPTYPLEPVSESDRPVLTTTGPMLGMYYPGFYNNSWLVSMTTGHTGYYATNVSPYTPSASSVIGGLPNNFWSQWFQDGQYYNGSHLIAPNSYACSAAGGSDYAHGACAIDGGTGGSAYAVGTIWWMWQLGQPEFPNTASSPMAEPNAAGATTITSATWTNSTITLKWAAPPGVVLNYTLAWGTPSGYGHFVNLYPWNTSYTLTGLAPDMHYDFAVMAWNLHYHGTSLGISSAITGPAIAMTPTQGPSGASVMVTGTAFSPGVTITTTIEGVATISGCGATVRGTGTFSCPITIFGTASATPYTVTASGSDGGTDLATGTFVVTTPGITVTPGQGPQGATMTVSGSGFSVSSGATVTFNAVAQTPTTCSGGTYDESTIATNTSGAFTCTFPVPSVSAGSHSVLGTDVATSALTSAQTFTVTTPSITVSPGQGPQGAAVTVWGSGFSVSSTVGLEFDGVAVLSCPDGDSLWTASSGDFACTFVVPSDASGTAVTVTDVGGQTVTGAFTVTTPTITVSPTQGPSGATVTVSGSGFTPGVTIAFTIGGNGTLGSPKPCVVSGMGNINSCTFTVSGATTSYTITATGSDGNFDHALATFRVSNGVPFPWWIVGVGGAGAAVVLLAVLLLRRRRRSTAGAGPG